MIVEEIRNGMKVRVKDDIEATRRLWGDPGYWGEDGRPILVDSVHFSVPRNSEHRQYVVEANGCYFDPQDLEAYEPKDSPEEVQIKTGIVLKFNPESL